MAGVGKFFLQREFVILLLFTVILLTPFLLRAGLTRLRIPMQTVSLVLISCLLMGGEAALFSEIIGGSEPELVEGNPLDASMLLGQYLRGSKGCLELAKKHCNTQVEVKGETFDAQIRVQKSDWETPHLFVYLNVKWAAREELPGLQRYFAGTMLFTAQYRCEAGTPILRKLKLKDTFFAPSSRVLSWLTGFIQIPYLRDEDSTILSKVENILVTQVKLCAHT